jgi:malic enzyme
LEEQLRNNALEYHRLPRPGKIAIQPTKQLTNQRDLALAYTPGDAALSGELRMRMFPNSRLQGEANLLIMPTLDAANIAFNLLKTSAGDGVTVGPILLGAARAVHIVTPSATVRRIVNMTALTVVDAAAPHVAGQGLF